MHYKQINTTHILQRKNPKGPNFGLLHRNMICAAFNALQELFNAKTIGFSTIKTHLGRFRFFIAFLGLHYGITDFRRIERKHVMAYANELKLSDKSDRSKQNYLSSVNTILGQARGDNACRVTGREANLLKQRSTRGSNKALSTQSFIDLLKELGPREGAISLLQRKLGLRFEEACKFDAKRGLKEAISKGLVTVRYGTKGGKVRTVDIHWESQTHALEKAAKVQGSHYSLIPKGMTYKKYKNYYYQVARRVNYRTHSQRHHFAQATFKNYIFKHCGFGISAPVSLGLSKRAFLRKLSSRYMKKHAMCFEEACKLAREVHDNARLYIAQQLGHERPQISDTYLY
ncbi:integrase domain-containing protein [uncultured Vibrio sp.]|uniref:integrase domain-containing protein n=1 Tax=uncultured Vibrio sp. TaxID=114054 RepID=UPI002600595E|nr:integrase domain-containing protein [uncultured Vibrio sp.]